MIEKAKPIEPGCRALIINSSYGNTGEVTALRLVRGDGNRTTLSDGMCIVLKLDIVYWEVDRLLNTSKYKNHCPYISEVKLIRLDDPDIQKEIEAEQCLVHSN